MKYIKTFEAFINEGKANEDNKEKISKLKGTIEDLKGDLMNVPRGQSGAKKSLKDRLAKAQKELKGLLSESEAMISESFNNDEMEAIYESAIEQEPRLSSGITEILNQQILNELESSQMYRSMSAWLDDAGWISGSQLFFKYADEELGHMSKIYKYLYEKNCRAKVPAVNEVEQEFKDVRAICEAALKHEMKVTKNWNDIANKAKSEDDHDTYTLALSYVNEQREEEEKIRNILFQMDLDMPKWKIDELFKSLI